MFNLNDMYYAASVLGVTFDRFPPEDFLSGNLSNVTPKTLAA